MDIPRIFQSNLLSIVSYVGRQTVLRIFCKHYSISSHFLEFDYLLSKPNNTSHVLLDDRFGYSRYDNFCSSNQTNQDSGFYYFFLQYNRLHWKKRTMKIWVILVVCENSCPVSKLGDKIHLHAIRNSPIVWSVENKIIRDF